VVMIARTVVLCLTRTVGTATAQVAVTEYASAKTMRRKYEAAITSVDVLIHY